MSLGGRTAHSGPIVSLKELDLLWRENFTSVVRNRRIWRGTLFLLTLLLLPTISVSLPERRTRKGPLRSPVLCHERNLRYATLRTFRRGEAAQAGPGRGYGDGCLVHPDGGSVPFGRHFGDRHLAHSTMRSATQCPIHDRRCVSFFFLEGQVICRKKM